MPTVPDHLKTGLSLIDHEHQTLLDLLQRTRGVCLERTAADCYSCPPERARQCFAAFERVLNESINYMLEHFAHEERLMDNGVPMEHADRHQAAHADIANAVMRLTTYLDSGNTVATSKKLADIFEGWMVRHIEDCDIELAQFVTAQDPARD